VRYVADADIEEVWDAEPLVDFESAAPVRGLDPQRLTSELVSSSVEGDALYARR